MGFKASLARSPELASNPNNVESVCGRSEACGPNDKAAFSRRPISLAENKNGFLRGGCARSLALGTSCRGQWR